MRTRQLIKIRQLLVLAAGVAALSVGVGGVSAYLTDGDAKGNPFVIAVNTITPEEDFEPPEPGRRTVKAPRAVNTGNAACYVRAKVLLTDSRAEDYLTYYNGESAGMNEEEWKPGKDGWMYRNAVLHPEEQTAPVFTHIYLKENVPGDLEIGVDVIFESVQSEGFENAADAFRSVEGNRKET